MNMYSISKVSEWNCCFNLLLEADVSEIESNGPGQFFLKRNGQRSQINIGRSSESDYARGIEEGLIPFVKSNLTKYDPNGFLFEGRLFFSVDGQEIRGRCHIVLPPSTDYPQVTIAKKSTSLRKLEDLAARGSMSDEMMAFLIAAMQASRTITFSGATGAGKTTMLEAMANLIPTNVRIGVAEDTPELVLPQPNVSYLHSVPAQPGLDPNSVASLSWVVQQFQRMRTDRLIIGETRGKEFADFLTAANSGMEGSLTTIHADDPVACLRKMTNFATEGRPNVPVRAINTDIANAVDIIVQLVLLRNGQHRVSHIQEIVPTLGTGEDAKITTQPLYLYDSNKDAFYKEGNMSDALRVQFANHGVNPERFLTSERSVRHPARKVHSSASVSKDNPISTSSNSSTRRLPTSPITGGRSI